MVIKLLIFLTLMGMITTGCQSIKQSPKYGFSEGYYRGRLFHKKLKSIYVIPGEDSIKVYSAKRLKEGFVDTIQSLKLAFPNHENPERFSNYQFRQNTFDVDLLSLLFKYRPAVRAFPNQFNASILNGAVYFGYRSDIFHIRYQQTPLKTYNRIITHYGYSFGIFTGLGATRIDEYVTRNALNIQYDGFVNLVGVAAIVAVDKLTFGLTLGFDHLQDRNKKLWIYQGKPWLGLGIGLNLN